MTARLRTANDLDMPGEWWAERRRWEADTHRLTVAALDIPVDEDIVGFSVTRDAPMGGEPTHQVRYARTAAR
jgi:hypothetical protein